MLSWPFTECGFAKSDIVFVLDSSESLSEANFNKIKTFMKKIAEETDERDTARIGSVSYNHFTYINFFLDENNTVCVYIWSSYSYTEYAWIGKHTRPIVKWSKTFALKSHLTTKLKLIVKLNPFRSKACTKFVYYRAQHCQHNVFDSRQNVFVYPYYAAWDKTFFYRHKIPWSWPLLMTMILLIMSW